MRSSLSIGRSSVFVEPSLFAPSFNPPSFHFFLLGLRFSQAHHSNGIPRCNSYESRVLSLFAITSLYRKQVRELMKHELSSNLIISFLKEETARPVDMSRFILTQHINMLVLRVRATCRSIEVISSTYASFVCKFQQIYLDIRNRILPFNVIMSSTVTTKIMYQLSCTCCIKRRYPKKQPFFKL